MVSLGRLDGVEAGGAELWGDGEGGLDRVRGGLPEAAEPALIVGSVDRDALERGQAIPVWVGFGLCVALEGPGLLTVRDAATDELWYTRNGDLKLDADGWVVTAKRGYRVQGFSETPFPAVRDLRLPIWEGGRVRSEEPYCLLDSAVFDTHGYLRVPRSDGTTVRLGRLKLGLPPMGSRMVPAGDGFWGMPSPGSGLGLASSHESGGARLAAESASAATRFQPGKLDPRFLDEAALRSLERRARFSQGALEVVEHGASLSLAGMGFFLIRDPDSEARWVTREGFFKWSEDGYLETERGWRYQGLAEPGGGSLADVRVRLGVLGTGTVEAVRSIDSRGRIWVTEADGEVREAAQMVLVLVPDPEVLEETIAHHFRLPEGGRGLEDVRWAVPGVQGMADLHPGSREKLGDLMGAFPSAIPARASQLVLSGVWGRGGRLQVSTDLRTWTEWLRFRSDQGRLIFELAPGWPGPAPASVGNNVFDALAPSLTGGFYRMVVDDDDGTGEGKRVER